MYCIHELLASLRSASNGLEHARSGHAVAARVSYFTGCHALGSNHSRRPDVSRPPPLLLEARPRLQSHRLLFRLWTGRRIWQARCVEQVWLLHTQSVHQLLPLVGCSCAGVCRELWDLHGEQEGFPYSRRHLSPFTVQRRVERNQGLHVHRRFLVVWNRVPACLRVAKGNIITVK